MIKYKKIFIACPEKTKTGGTELLHQLAFQLNELDVCCYMFYYNATDNTPMNVAFKQYNAKYVTGIDSKDNNEENLMIVPEVKTSLIYKYSKMKSVIWWLSVDNYISAIYDKLGISKQILKNIGRKLCGRKIVNIKLIEKTKHAFSFAKQDARIFHLCQSYYAMDFLEKQNVTNKQYLSDYINQIYLTNSLNLKKENIVLYNPKKGAKFTEIIRNSSKKLNWVPLVNLSNEEVKELLYRSKVYIDFGNHPGKDRFPREAAACGCCIITGKLGSAKFEEDIPIPGEFKFEDNISEISSIVSKINICLTDYENQVKKIKNYRDYISGEKETFKNDVKRIFCE
ncbi:hypothetical protein [Clostridium estertheticum]|uniref:hypothetical protein n=1 Tax=Clostridium estertheticum TaxID=238834 RepID=UPI001CF158CA|nr:hypothetical protein [Clostridium estertheticum]MCB2357868.1 hypothetical protein [Clostridium estertheticum]